MSTLHENGSFHLSKCIDKSVKIFWCDHWNLFKLWIENSKRYFDPYLCLLLSRVYYRGSIHWRYLLQMLMAETTPFTAFPIVSIFHHALAGMGLINNFVIIESSVVLWSLLTSSSVRDIKAWSVAMVIAAHFPCMIVLYFSQAWLVLCFKSGAVIICNSTRWINEDQGSRLN